MKASAESLRRRLRIKLEELDEFSCLSDACDPDQLAKRVWDALTFRLLREGRLLAKRSTPKERRKFDLDLFGMPASQFRGLPRRFRHLAAEVEGFSRSVFGGPEATKGWFERLALATDRSADLPLVDEWINNWLTPLPAGLRYFADYLSFLTRNARRDRNARLRMADEFMEVALVEWVTQQTGQHHFAELAEVLRAAYLARIVYLANAFRGRPAGREAVEQVRDHARQHYRRGSLQRRYDRFTAELGARRLARPPLSSTSPETTP